MNGTANVKTVMTGALAACAIAAVGLVAAPAATAATPRPAAGTHTYDPNARQGSIDNPIILNGGSPLLTGAQQKLLDQAKEQLASGQAQSQNKSQDKAQDKGQAKSAAGAQPGTLDATTVLQPQFNNCGQSGFYYCYEVTSTIGSVMDATILGSGNHEYAEAEGLGKNSNDWGVYLDQSTNGGATWTGQINEIINGTEWSDPIYDGPGYVDRACLTDIQHGLYVCTPWH